MSELKGFQNKVSESLFSADKSFQQFILYYTGAGEAERLSAVLSDWEQKVAYWNSLADEAGRPEKLPRLEKYDRVGNPFEKVSLPLETRAIRHQVVAEGIFHNRSELEKFSKIYMLAQMGESGVTCPLACTDGLIRVLEAEGSEFLKETYLDKVTSVETPLAGAQFVTEQSGGSDVGAIEGTALRKQDDSYRITAEKWYCSTPEEFFLVAARVEGAEQGTKGLSIFFVPRQIEDDEGQLKINDLSYKRLKDKFGTQSLPTAEIDFNGSIGYCIGQESEGFSNLMNYVLNCSRVHNSANALGIHRRAFTEARNYALQREAFGSEIINYPLIAESLVQMLSELNARHILFSKLLTNIDNVGLTPEDREERYRNRFLINLLKYRTASRLTTMVKQAIIIFGANGVINDFSILPRLLRDSLVIETWEGTHNTLCLQILRDTHRFEFFDFINGEIEEILTEWPDDILQDSKKYYEHVYQMGKELFTPSNMYEGEWIQTHARRFVDHYADLLESGHLLIAGVKLGDCNLMIQASYLMHEWFSDRFAAFASPTIAHLSNICLDLIRENPVDIDMK